MLKKEFVFIEAKPFSGISKKSGEPFTLRKIKLADPLTYENHSLDFIEGLKVDHVAKGDKVTLELDLQAPFGMNDSRVIVTAIQPVKVKSFS